MNPLPVTTVNGNPLRDDVMAGEGGPLHDRVKTTQCHRARHVSTGERDEQPGRVIGGQEGFLKLEVQKTCIVVLLPL